MPKYVLWNADVEWLGKDSPDYMCEIEFAKQLGIELFEPEETFTFSGMHYLIAQDPRKKVVLKHWRNHEEVDCLTEDLSWADLLILYTNDVIIGPWEEYSRAVFEQYNCKKFICIAEGRHNMFDHPIDRVYEDHEYHASRIVNFCRYEEWNMPLDKPKIFDALLGSCHNTIKPHRKFVFEQLQKNKLIDKSFVNIWGSINYRSPELKQLDDPEIINYRNSMIYTDRFKNGRSMSHSIPIEIYKRSWYSIVAETQAYKSNYITEKTAKPLFEKKLFVMFGAQGVLERLRELGYQTFSSVIDESYDSEPDDTKRWTMAFNEVLKLLDADHQTVYDKITPVLEHNHGWIISNHRNRLQGLKDFLDMHINQL